MTTTLIAPPFSISRVVVRTFAASLLAVTPWVSGAAELGRPDLSDDDFVKRVTGQFGVLPDREPALSEGEIAVLERLAPMIQRNPDMVISALTTLQVDGRPMSATFDQMLGNIYSGQHAWAQAEESYLRAIAKFPDFQRAWNSLGALRMEQGKYEEAAKALSRSIELGAADAHTFGLLGYALLQGKKYIAAEVAYDMALLREPDSLRWLEGKVRIIAESGRHEEAVAAIKELLRRDATNSEYWRLQANAYLALSDLAATARDLEISRLLGSVNGDGLYLLGNLYLKQGMPGLAFNAYLSAMELQPASSPDLIVGVGRALIARNQFDLAERLLEAASQQTEAWPSAAQLDRHVLQGRLAEQKSDFAGAQAEFEKALEISPLHRESLFRLAKVLHAEKQSARAEYILEKIQGDTTYEYAAQLFLARVRIESDRYEAALDPLRKAMRLRPGSEAENLYNRVRAALATQQRS